MAATQEQLAYLIDMAAQMRLQIVRMMGPKKVHHFGGSLSATDIVTALYFYKMNYDPQNPTWPDRDRFVMSKGHSVPAQYAALALKGVIPLAELSTLKRLGSRLQGHPAMHHTPGIEACTGMLGEGLSFSNGLALAARIRGQDYRVYCLMGDGELQEGQVWEAAMTTPSRQLSSVTAILDRNRLKSQDDPNTAKIMDPMDRRWQSFGWVTREIDGHDMAQICDALDWATEPRSQPAMIIANTVKGKGVSFFEGQAKYHNAQITEEEFQRALAELSPAVVEKVEKIMSPMTETRMAYGEALAELGESNPDVVVLDADLYNSTRTVLFRDKFPKRFFDMGISEADMASTAAGLAAAGMTPFINSFAIFATSICYLPVRTQIAYPNLRVIVAGSSAGLTQGPDGASHQSLEDISLMRGLPNMTVIVPADALETRQAVFAAAECPGPVYLRLGRYPVPDLNAPDYQFKIGKAVTLREGNQVTLFATGHMVSKAVEAHEILAQAGISARVVNVSTIKPLDEAAVLQLARETGLLFSVEEHSIIGGLGSALAEYLSGQANVPRLVRLGVRDEFGESGVAEELLVRHRLTGPLIAEDVQAAL